MTSMTEFLEKCHEDELKTSFDVLDGLLSHDKEDLVERVAYLENKVQQQEDEIVCLKSAVADIIRRLASVEAVTHNTVVTARTHSRTPLARPRSMAALPSTRNKSHLSALDNVNVMSRRNAPFSTRGPPKSSRHSSAHSLSKWSSLGTSTEMSNSLLTPTSLI